MAARGIFRNRSLIDILEWGLRRSIGLSTAGLRLLPDFIIIGAQRSGTTSLFKYICRHPNIYPSFPKEVHYFSNNFQKGVYWYRSHFPLSVYKSRVERDGKGRFVTGEATPYYLSHPHAPKRVFELIPNALLIVLLRNPVDRAYSHYYHEVMLGLETLSFEEAIEREDERISMEKQLMLENENYRSFNHQNFSYVSRGIYVEHLKSWNNYFNQEQILVLDTDTFDKNPNTVVKKTTKFLGLPDWELNDNYKYHLSNYPPMSHTTRKRLQSFYKPYNQRLFEYLGKSLSWDV